MKNTNIRRFLYHAKYRYFTLNNGVIALALLISLGFVWGSLSVMERNYTLQRTLDKKSQELALAELEVRNLELETRYYTTDEYLELAARERLGLANSGEHELILPANTPKAEEATSNTATPAVSTDIEPTNFEQWIDFLFGTNRSRLQ